jgi:hypothetical protein
VPARRWVQRLIEEGVDVNFTEPGSGWPPSTPSPGPHREGACYLCAWQAVCADRSRRKGPRRSRASAARTSSRREHDQRERVLSAELRAPSRVQFRGLAWHGWRDDGAVQTRCSALCLAATHGHLSTARELRLAGADINQLNKWRYRVQPDAVWKHHALGSPPGARASGRARRGPQCVPERLWPRLASAIGMHARSGTQCVFESAGFRWSWSQLELWGVSLAPLYYASHGGHAATVEWLLGEKARVDHSNAYGCAPRHPHGAALIILAVLCASRSCVVCACGFAQWSVMCMRVRARAHACVCVCVRANLERNPGCLQLHGPYGGGSGWQHQCRRIATGCTSRRGCSQRRRVTRGAASAGGCTSSVVG